MSALSAVSASKSVSLSQRRRPVNPRDAFPKHYLHEYGASGVESVGGFITNTEYNIELRGQMGCTFSTRCAAAPPRWPPYSS